MDRWIETVIGGGGGGDGGGVEWITDNATIAIVIATIAVVTQIDSRFFFEARR